MTVANEFVKNLGGGGMTNVFVQCDRCPSAAKSAWEKDALMLLFCGHHGNNHRAALIGQGWRCTEIAE